MKLVGSGILVELEWWVEFYNMDFYVIFDVCNEVFVVFLGFKKLDVYIYNNVVYMVLYKLIGED